MITATWSNICLPLGLMQTAPMFLFMCLDHIKILLLIISAWSNICLLSELYRRRPCSCLCAESIEVPIIFGLWSFRFFWSWKFWSNQLSRLFWINYLGQDKSTILIVKSTIWTASTTLVELLVRYWCVQLCYLNGLLSQLPESDRVNYPNRSTIQGQLSEWINYPKSTIRE